MVIEAAKVSVTFSNESAGWQQSLSRIRRRSMPLSMEENRSCLIGVPPSITVYIAALPQSPMTQVLETTIAV